MTLKQGDIVLIPVPFTDLSSNKKRPLLILSGSSYNNITEDIIGMAITSHIDEKTYAVSITNDDMKEGFLSRDSCVRTDKIYTLSHSAVVKKFGSVKNEIIPIVIGKMLSIFEQERNL